VWLLDANIDVRVCEILAEFGVDSRTAESFGWKELSNGNLVAAAVENGFTCLLTRDRLFGESAARTLKQFPAFAIVVIQLKQQKWPAYGQDFRRAWEREPIVPSAGRCIAWPNPS
jgi:predicted nuclease of predicted toxin-antitoxin system